MIEALQAIPGPRFLWIFPLLSLTLGLFGTLLLGLQGGGGVFPPPGRFSAESLAVLRGGRRELIETVLFHLWQRQAINEEEDEGEKKLRWVDAAWRGESPLERALYRLLQKPRDPTKLQRDTELCRLADSVVEARRRELAATGMLLTAVQRQVRQLVAWGVLAAVYGGGGLKLMLGLQRGKPVLGLILEMLLLLPFLLWGLKPLARRTTFGRRYLKRMRQHFDWVREAMKQGVVDGIEPSYAYALFGGSLLTSASPYRTMQSILFPHQWNGSSSSSGCSGCSDGGCSGGGGCGGGCGGCGGD
ncbi:MAG: hypothetical protein C0621_10695 [Desulfuromonas sp.]|nr:MAG: hypothetical protein C0621_10695 [Desulfuromonas sp.]